jgi:hypothetical protein
MLCFEAGLLVAASLLAAFAYLNALFGLRPATVQLLRAQLCYLVSQSKHDYGNPSLSISFRVTKSHTVCRYLRSATFNAPSRNSIGKSAITFAMRGIPETATSRIFSLSDPPAI